MFLAFHSAELKRFSMRISNPNNLGCSPNEMLLLKSLNRPIPLTDIKYQPGRQVAPAEINIH